MLNWLFFIGYNTSLEFGIAVAKLMHGAEPHR